MTEPAKAEPIEEWFVMDGTSGNYLRGPYKCQHAAGSVRAEMELNASDKTNERWNLWVVCGRQQKGENE